MSNTDAIEVLVVDDDEDFRGALVRRFSRGIFHVLEAGDGAAALSLLQRHEFDVAVIDVTMPRLSGIELLEKMRVQNSDCEVVVLTGQGTIETAVRAMKLGAFDYLQKPFPLQELEDIVRRAFEKRQLQNENCHLKALLERAQPQAEIVGRSPALLEVFRLIERAGPSDKAVLIQGESGTGKELVARALHRISNRAEKPLVVINCAALPETLLESELFGHEKGSFTGASNAKPGLFEIADGGTLFIDEIGEMPGALQAKLLRVLEDGSLRRVGSIKERKVNVRLLVATNRNLHEAVKNGQFREDLFYRINVMSLELPPLRARHGDIRLLVNRFLGPHWQIEDEALRALERYWWPGNVRQLINAMERGKIMADGNVIRSKDLPHEVIDPAPPNQATASSPVDDDLTTIQRAKVIEILRRERGNKSRAARALGIDRRTLYRLVEKYQIDLGGFPKNV